MTSKRAVVSKQNLPSFLNYGREIVENNITLIVTDNSPTPLALTELSTCGCKTECKTHHCKGSKKDFHEQTCINVQNVKITTYNNDIVFQDF